MTTTVVAMSTPVTGQPAADGTLVARIVAGDDRALGLVYDRYGSLVYGLARRVTSSTAAAEEITQEVFVQFWEHADRFDATKGSLRAFLGAITHRRSVDWVRSEARRREREARTAQDAATGTVATVVDITTELGARDTAARVRAAVETLPLEQREAVVLAYFGGLTFREVAARLGCRRGRQIPASHPRQPPCSPRGDAWTEPPVARRPGRSRSMPSRPTSWRPRCPPDGIESGGVDELGWREVLGGPRRLTADEPPWGCGGGRWNGARQAGHRRPMGGSRDPRQRGLPPAIAALGELLVDLSPAEWGVDHRGLDRQGLVTPRRRRGVLRAPARPLAARDRRGAGADHLG